MPRLSIVIINYNSLGHTLECLDSLQQLNWAGKLTIYVLDNHSLNNPRSAIKAKFPGVKCLRSKTNLGFAAGNNFVIDKARQSGADLVMLLNTVTKILPQLAHYLYQPIKKSQADITVPKIYFYSGFEFHQHRYNHSQRGRVIWYAGGRIDWQNISGIHLGVDQVDRGQFDKSKYVEFATGCCTMISTKVIEKIGLFDPKYFLYLEDADFSVRANRAGFNIYYQPQAKLWHKNAESSGGSGSSLQDYYFTRNRLLFGFRYASLRTKFALLRQSFKQLFTGSSWQKKGVIDYFINNLNQGSYAA